MAKDKSEKKDKKRKETKVVTETATESIEVNDDVEMEDAELVKVGQTLHVNADKLHPAIV